MPRTMPLIKEGNGEGETACLVRPFEFGEAIEWKNEGVDTVTELTESGSSGQDEKTTAERAKEEVMEMYERQFQGSVSK